MNRVSSLVSRVFVVLCCMGAAVAQAAGYPQKPIEMVVAGSPGGGLDLLGRALVSALDQS